MVYLEPAGPVPSQSLAWHSRSRGHISSCDLKILKELVLTSQSGYQISFSNNLLFIEKMCLRQLLCVMEARERRLPTASASPPSSAFSVCRHPILIPLHCVRSTHANAGHALHLPGAHLWEVTESPIVSSSEQGKGIPCCLFGHQCNLFFVFPNYENGESSLRKSLNFWSELAKIHVWILWLG